MAGHNRRDYRLISALIGSEFILHRPELQFKRQMLFLYGFCLLTSTGGLPHKLLYLILIFDLIGLDWD
ncbi:MAG: hypothetical protein EAX86_01160 [Candidatus Heimdallarchaeota archaeon]|nr:hypothetical protein [Candidatus Heimdallarchaeota archaeon]